MIDTGSACSKKTNMYMNATNNRWFHCSIHKIVKTSGAPRCLHPVDPVATPEAMGVLTFLEVGFELLRRKGQNQAKFPDKPQKK